MVDLDGEPWFVAADVARALGYRDGPALTRRLDDDEQGYTEVSTPGGVQQMTVINESGVYTAILGSRVEGAKAFKGWITHEVLHPIRRTDSDTVASAFLPIPDRAKVSCAAAGGRVETLFRGAPKEATRGRPAPMSTFPGTPRTSSR